MMVYITTYFMMMKTILLWFIVYIIWVTSTFLHELGHIRWAKKYNLTILKSRKEVVINKQEKELSRFSFLLKS